MPLLSRVCLVCARTFDYLAPKEAAPETCGCGGTLAGAVTAPTGISVTGTVGGRRVRFARESNHVEPVRAGFRVEHETATTRMLVKGSGHRFVTTKWTCAAGHRTIRVDDERPACPPSCDSCGGATAEVPVEMPADWFREACGGDPRGYWSDNFGCWVTSREHRRQLMEARGWVDIGEIGESTLDARERTDRERVAREDEEMREYLARDLEGDAELRRQRDRGNPAVLDWTPWMEHLGMK